MKFVSALFLSGLAVASARLSPEDMKAKTPEEKKAAMNSMIKAMSAGRKGENGSSNNAARRRKLSGKGSDDEPDLNVCDNACPYEFHYRYVPNDGTAFWDGIYIDADQGCRLASITDEKTRRGAQYAIPDGKIALTQGYFPLHDYFHCHFEHDKTDDGIVTGCPDAGYNDMFYNFDGTKVVDDDDCWVHFDDIDDGAIYAAIGSDGLLRPVQGWNKDGEEDLGYHGYVYECCPFYSDVCGDPVGPWFLDEFYAAIGVDTDPKPIDIIPALIEADALGVAVLADYLASTRNAG